MEKLMKKKWQLMDDEKIKEEYYEYLLKNNKLKFIKLTRKDPLVRNVCLGTFTQEEGFEVQKIDCESEMDRAKQMNYFPPP